MVFLSALSLATLVLRAQPGSAEADLSPAAIQKAVLETNAKMIQAANNLNADAFFDYILPGEQCVLIQNGRAFKTRQEALEAVKTGFRGVDKMNRQFEDPRVTMLATDTALLTSEGTVSARLTDGREINARFAVSLVFVRRDGKWKVLHGHYSMPLRNQ